MCTGYTVKDKLYLDDENDRYFHIYHSTGKEHGEKEELEELLERMAKSLEAQYGTDYQLSDAEKKYFDTFYDGEGILTLVKEKDDVIKRELQLCGYFCIVTSDKMTAAEALNLYCSRDVSEKLFRGDKSYLGNKSERTHLNESTDAKIFLEFVALIVRNRIYKKLKEEYDRIDENPNYMTVPAALRELEKIEMIRGHDQIYRLDHAVTKTQKVILKAFGMDAAYVKQRANRISEQLQIADNVGRQEEMARMTKESLEAKIKKAEERVVKTGETYNSACEELKNLRNKMAAIENEALVEAFMKSNKTIEEAIAFFESDMKSDDMKETPKRRGGRLKKTTE